jgi:hypothetical protein
MLHQDSPAPNPQRKSETKPSGKTDDEVKQLLKRAAKRGGPWSRGRLLAALVLLVLVLGLATWWLWPRRESPQLIVVPFDQVVLPDKAVTVRAATEPLDGSDVRWGGRDVFFLDKANALDTSGKAHRVRTDKNGLATCEWQGAASGSYAEFEVSYLDERIKPPWNDRAHGRIFTWGPSTRLLVLDVEPTMKKADAGEAMGRALAGAVEKGWKVVYLGVNADGPLTYRKLREWALERTGPGMDAAPEGPVLARKTFYDGAGEAEARKAVLAELKRDFHGALLYLTAEHGLRLWALAADGGLAGEARNVRDWAELVKTLPE